MGWAKYTEDIRRDVEINIERVRPVKIKAKTPSKYIIQCIYCMDTFTSNNDLFNHMRTQHNTLDTVIQLNGRILEPGEYIEITIDAIRLFPVKEISSFRINRKQYDVVINNGYVDISPDMYVDNDEKIVIEIDSRIWIIHISRKCSVTSKVDVFIDDLNESIFNRQRPDLSMLKRKIEKEDLDELDKQYIYAFYEYCLACMISGLDKDARYFTAYNMLLPYIEADTRALMIVKLICIRYLWVDKLDELCRLSWPNEFSLVCAFFKGLQKLDAVEKDKGRSRSDNMFSIFVEDDEYNNTQEIVNFMNGNYNAVKRYLGKAKKQADEGDLPINLRDKIFLLQARFSEHVGNNDEALYYYDRMHNQIIINREEPK